MSGLRLIANIYLKLFEKKPLFQRFTIKKLFDIFEISRIIKDGYGKTHNRS